MNFVWLCFRTIQPFTTFKIRLEELCIEFFIRDSYLILGSVRRVSEKIDKNQRNRQHRKWQRTEPLDRRPGEAAAGVWGWNLKLERVKSLRFHSRRKKNYRLPWRWQLRSLFQYITMESFSWTRFMGDSWPWMSLLNSSETFSSSLMSENTFVSSSTKLQIHVESSKRKTKSALSS